MRFTTRPKILAASFAGAAFLLGGCGLGDEAVERGMEEAIEAGASDGTEVDIDADGGKVKVEDSDGSVEFGGDTELPESFPDDVPLPEGEFEVRMATENSDGTMMASLFTNGEVATIGDHVESGLTSSGYQIDESMDGQAGGTEHRQLTASGNGIEVVITITGTEDGTVGVQYHIEQADPGA